MGGSSTEESPARSLATGGKEALPRAGAGWRGRRGLHLSRGAMTVEPPQVSAAGSMRFWAYSEGNADRICQWMEGE